MKWTKEDIQRVRDISIAQTMGVQSGRRTNIVCPMPNHNDRTASFLLDEDNGFHCFGCQARGKGFIDFCTLILTQDGEEPEGIFYKIMEEYGN